MLDVDPFSAGLLIFTLALLLMVSGVPIAFGFLIVNVIGAFILMDGWLGVVQLVDNSTSLITTFRLVSIPLFVFMGALFFHSGLASRVFDSLDALFGKMRGRLSYVTVLGGTTFSALTGSTMANTAMLGSLMVPEMHKRGYSKMLSIGPIIGTGGLAMIIPPSNLSVLLGSMARIDIASLLVAGILPGILLAVFYCFTIFFQVLINPSGAPAYTIPSITWAQRLTLFITNIVPMFAVIFLIVGLIVTGLTTPSEAAAFGVVIAALIAFLTGSLNLSTIYQSLETTIMVTGMLLLLIFASSAFSQLLSFSGVTSEILSLAINWETSPINKLLMMFFILLILGMFMDQLSILLITIPFFFPLAIAIGYDPVWFGIVVLLAMEMSLTTPPFGLLLFLMSGVAPKGTTLKDVMLSALPFLFSDVVLLVLLILFPAIALWLPSFTS